MINRYDFIDEVAGAGDPALVSTTLHSLADEIEKAYDVVDLHVPQINSLIDWLRGE